MSLNSFLEHILVCFRAKSPKPGETSDEEASYVLPNSINTEECRALRTWPNEKLKQTVGNILTSNGIDPESERFTYLFSNISKELNEECPFQILDNYDFCVISARADQTEAMELIKEIEDNLKLSGFNFWEAVVLGRDEFEAYEEVIDRSSKVIFYITENFTKDEFCLHLARNTFVAPMERTAGKVIPIVNDVSTKMPDSLLLVEKLLRHDPCRMELRLSFIFNASVRLEKNLRIERHTLDMDARRMEWLNRTLVLHNLIE